MKRTRSDANPSALPGTAPVPADDPLLTKINAAHFVGVSHSEFKRREKLGIYVPTRFNENGWALYSVAYLTKLRDQAPMTFEARSAGGRRTSASKPTRKELVHANPPPEQVHYEPEVAARIFEELENRTSLVAIVQKLKVLPNIVKAIHGEWVELKTIDAGIYVSGKVMIAISELPLPGSFPIKNEEKLLSYLQELAQSSEPSPVCTHCKKHPRRYCQRCVDAVFDDGVATGRLKK